MIPFKAKLKNQLALLNTVTKALIIIWLVVLIPTFVSSVFIKNSDDLLFEKLDKVYDMIETNGIEEFIDEDNEFGAFGSYNILKDEYISIELTEEDSIYESIETAQRIIDDDIIDYRVLSATIGYGDDEYYLIEIGSSIAAVDHFVASLQNYALLFLVVVLLITVLFDLLFVRYLLVPFDKIVEKLRRTDHPENFDHKKVETSTSDFAYLDTTIEQLMIRIEKAFKNEREYIGNVSHELLTPISIIQTKLDNILNETELPENVLIKIFDSKKTLSRLTTMVRTFLLMSRIENQEFILKDNFRLNDVLSEVLDEVDVRIEAKELRLVYECSNTMEPIMGDKTLVFNLFFNLVNNAIKFAPKGGEITVSSEIVNDKQLFSVSDNGQGIRPENLPFIFDRFKKFQDSGDNFGLGLALVKKICDYHKIDIRVESEFGKGTCFYLEV